MWLNSRCSNLFTAGCEQWESNPQKRRTKSKNLWLDPPGHGDDKLVMMGGRAGHHFCYEMLGISNCWSKSVDWLSVLRGMVMYYFFVAIFRPRNSWGKWAELKMLQGRLITEDTDLAVVDFLDQRQVHLWRSERPLSSPASMSSTFPQPQPSNTLYVPIIIIIIIIINHHIIIYPSQHGVVVCPFWNTALWVHFCCYLDRPPTVASTFCGF